MTGSRENQILFMSLNRFLDVKGGAVIGKEVGFEERAKLKLEGKRNAMGLTHLAGGVDGVVKSAGTHLEA